MFLKKSMTCTARGMFRTLVGSCYDPLIWFSVTHDQVKMIDLRCVGKCGYNYDTILTYEHAYMNATEKITLQSKQYILPKFVLYILRLRISWLDTGGHNLLPARCTLDHHSYTTRLIHVSGLLESALELCIWKRTGNLNNTALPGFTLVGYYRTMVYYTSILTAGHWY